MLFCFKANSMPSYTFPMAAEAPKAAQTTTLAEIYTDGSCYTQNLIGAWVAILLIGPEKVILAGVIPGYHAQPDGADTAVIRSP